MRLDKQELVRRLRRDFIKYNEFVDPERIDFNSYADTELTYGENIGLFQENFPSYRWE
jgi:hypothetical protein